MLLDRIKSELNSAVKNRDQAKVDTLRYLLGEVKNLEIVKYPPDKGGPPSFGLSDEEVFLVLQRQVKTHKESIESFTNAGRWELVDREKAQLDILLSYLPKQMEEEEVKLQLRKIVAANRGADFGTMMKLSIGKLKGKAEGALVSKILREMLQSN